MIIIETHWEVVYLHRCTSTHLQDLDTLYCELFGSNLHIEQYNMRTPRQTKKPDLSIFTIRWRSFVKPVSYRRFKYTQLSLIYEKAFSKHYLQDPDLHNESINKSWMSHELGTLYKKRLTGFLTAFQSLLTKDMGPATVLIRFSRRLCPELSVRWHGFATKTSHNNGIRQPFLDQWPWRNGE